MKSGRFRRAQVARPLFFLTACCLMACSGEKDDGGGDLKVGSYPGTPSGGAGPTVIAAGAGGGGAGGMGGAGGAPPPSCETTLTCSTSDSLGIISGDTGSASVDVMGSTEDWVSVRLTEDDNGATGEELSATITLNPPVEVDFDLYVYLNEDNDALACGTPYASSANSNATEQISIEWGEGAIPNGDVDARDVVIEVRQRSGECTGPMWTLFVDGNTN